MQSLLRSMTPQQRAELQSMMDALLRDDRLRWDLARLASNMDQLMPDGVGESYDFSGDEPLGLEPALDRIGQLQALDALEDELAEIGSPGRPRRPRSRRRRAAARDRSPARDLEALDELARQLEDAGYLIAQGRSARADAARQPADRPEGPRRPVREAVPRRVRRPSDRSVRAGRGARGDDQAVRVRRPVPPRHPGHDRERAPPAGERAVRAAGSRRARRPPLAGRLRGLPDRAADEDLDGAARRHEPLDAPARLLPGRQEGRGRARHADPDPVPARRPDRHRLRLLRPRAPPGGPRRADAGTATSTGRTSSTG